MLSLWRAQPYGTVCSDRHVGRVYVDFPPQLVDRRDCLAPPYSVTEDMHGAKAPVKTCYKCKKDGHVRCSSPLCSSFLAVNAGTLQIARDCIEGQEVVEEDNTWGEITDDNPWGGGGGGGTFSEGN
jgi:hypothetical protein